MKDTKPAVRTKNDNQRCKIMLQRIYRMLHFMHFFGNFVHSSIQTFCMCGQEDHDSNQDQLTSQIESNDKLTKYQLQTFQTSRDYMKQLNYLII